MPNMLIRDVPPEMHRVLKQRAQEAGMSVQSYVLSVLQEQTQRMTMSEWLAEAAKLPKLDGWVGAEAVREAREELP